MLPATRLSEGMVARLHPREDRPCRGQRAAWSNGTTRGRVTRRAGPLAL